VRDEELTGLEPVDIASTGANVSPGMAPATAMEPTTD